MWCFTANVIQLTRFGLSEAEPCASVDNDWSGSGLDRYMPWEEKGQQKKTKEPYLILDGNKLEDMPCDASEEKTTHTDEHQWLFGF